MGRSRILLILAISLIAGLVLFVTFKSDEPPPQVVDVAPAEMDSTASASETNESTTTNTTPDAVEVEEPRDGMRPAIPNEPWAPTEDSADPAPSSNAPPMPLNEQEFEAARQQAIIEQYGEAGPPKCDVRCDCPQGQQCTAAGFCMPSVQPVYCCESLDCPEGESCRYADESPGLCGPQD